VKLNLGCGHDYRYDRAWVNYDMTFPANVIGDCTQGLPFRNASFDEVWASHILEHIPDLRALQTELARVTRLGGILKAIVPNYDSVDAWGDPTHCRAFSSESFQNAYWQGFNLIDIDVRNLRKKGASMGVNWIFVTLMRNEVSYSVVRANQSGRRTIKTGGYKGPFGFKA